MGRISIASGQPGSALHVPPPGTRRSGACWCLRVLGYRRAMPWNVCKKSTGARLLGLLLVLTACGGPADEGGAGVDEVVEVVEGTAGGGDWSVEEYVESDPTFVDTPERCLRIEPEIGPGPFFCESEGISGDHGRLVLRSDRFGDDLVFTGVFAPEVAHVRLGTELLDVTPWGEDGLGVVVEMREAPDEETYTYSVDLLDESGEVLSRGGAQAQRSGN